MVVFIPCTFPINTQRSGYYYYEAYSEVRYFKFISK